MTKPSAIKPYRAAWLVGLTALLAAACSTEVVDPSVAPTDEGVRVTLTLNLGSAATTRLDYDTVPGTDYENYIDPSLVRVCLFDGNSATNDNCTFNQYFTPSEVVQSVSNPEVYYLTGSLDALPTGPYKVVVLANWPSMPNLTKGSSTIDYLTTMCGTFSSVINKSITFVPSASQPIPMFGIRTYDTVNNVTGHGLDFGNVTLTRALAKIVVASQDATLSDVTLKYMYTLGQAAPYGMYSFTAYSEHDNINVTWDRASPNVSGLNTLQNMAFTEKKVSGWAKWYEIYTSEYLNTGTRPKKSDGKANPDQGKVNVNSISINFQGQSYQIDFKEYESDYQDPFDILRNYRYVYYVEKNRITYSVVPYDSLTSEEILFK